MYEMLRNCSFDENLGFLGYSHSEEVDCSRCQTSWYLYQFNMGLMSSVEASVEPSWKYLNDGAVLTDYKLRKVSVIFVERQ